MIWAGPAVFQCPTLMGLLNQQPYRIFNTRLIIFLQFMVASTGQAPQLMQVKAKYWFIYHGAKNV